MYSFEGDFRRHPVQSYRGASKKESRDDIVRKAQEERRKRELERKKEECALRIEAFVRGCLARKRIYRDLRSRFDELQKEVAAESGRGLTQKEEVFLTLVQWLVYFFRQQTDQKRLDWLASFLMKNQKQISSWRQENPAVWRRKLQWILHLSLRHLSQTGNHFLPLRLLEIFTQNESNAKELFFFLIKRGYYTDLRRLLDQRVPPVIDASPNPPTPLADCIYDLMVRPLALIKDSAIDSPFTLSCLGALNGQVLSTPYSEQVELFLLPALRQRTPNFPFKELLAFLSRPEASLEVPWTLYSILYLGMRHLRQLMPTLLYLSLFVFAHISIVASLAGILLVPDWTDDPSSMAYLQVLSRLMREFPCRSFLQMHYGSDEPSSDGEDEESTMEVDFSTDQHSSLEAQCLEMLNNPEQVKEIVLTVVRLPNPVTFHVASIAYGLLCYHSNAMHEYRLLQTLALQPLFLQKLWRHLHDGKSSASSSPNFYSQLKQLSSGINLNAEDSDGLIPLLASFPASLSILFLLLNDEELFGSPGTTSRSLLMPFNETELQRISGILRDVCLGLLEVLHPDAKLLGNVLSLHRERQWKHLFKLCVRVVRQLHLRDMRRNFCPEEFWVSSRVKVPWESLMSSFSFRSSRRAQVRRRPLVGPHLLPNNAAPNKELLLPLSAKETRLSMILQELPFTISFTDRIHILQQFINQEKEDHQGEAVNFLHGPSIIIKIRRDHIYEDAFDRLSPENEPNLKLVMRVTLMNAVGLDEAGIDGGGIFREFLSELLKTAFDPNLGFFSLTQENTLYPSPHIRALEPDFQKHYFFIGRVLGKALYENLLVEIPLASFFLFKLLGKGDSVDIHYLKSLDPVVYRNLLELRTYEGDVSELDLDFTTVSEILGQAEVIELKPGGRSMPVTSSNVIEYIHLMADYRLNVEIRSQCIAFKKGLEDVLSLDWLAMFSPAEFQTLISGASIPVDIANLQEFTKYGGGYSADHLVIKSFWRVVSGFSDRQKSQLLKFVTSCSRPPLLGFKELHPPFCIQSAGQDLERLPSASTCMNLLKLPEYRTEEVLCEKLLYAIESGAGFELS